MLVDHLRTEFARRTQKNPHYSLRAFAKSLDISSASLSSILTGKRGLGPKSTRHLLDRLQLDPSTRRKLLLSVLDNSPVVSDGFEELDADTFKKICSWEYDAVLCLLQIRRKKWTAKDIARELGMGFGIALETLNCLEKLGLVQKKKDGWTTVKAKIASPPQMPASALRHVNKQYLKKAFEALENLPSEAREVSGTTMAIPRAKLTEAREIIREFRRSLCALLETKNSNQVFRLNIQFFPISKGDTK